MRTLILGLALTVVLAGCGENDASKAGAAKQSSGNAAAGKAVAERDCKNCHGLDGKGAAPAIPHLAAQRERYLLAALTEYKGGKRPHAALRDMTAHMTDTEMRNVAAYYASLPPISIGGGKAPSTAYEQGKALVAAACAQCHGGDKALPHLNLFDIDNWKDRASARDTFAMVTTRSPASVISTGKCNVTPVNVARQLNQEIQRHNDLPGLKTPAFVREAVVSWNLKHARADYVPITDRSFGKTRWGSQVKADDELLRMLNRYCYRCHGTIRFDIYNRSQVVAMSKRAVRQIDLGLMPLDRQGDRLLPEAERRRLVELLSALR